MPKRVKVKKKPEAVVQWALEVTVHENTLPGDVEIIANALATLSNYFGGIHKFGGAGGSGSGGQLIPTIIQGGQRPQAGSAT